MSRMSEMATNVEAMLGKNYLDYTPSLISTIEPFRLTVLGATMQRWYRRSSSI